MNSLQKHLNDARRRLLFPLQSSCNDGILTPYCIDVIDELVIRRGNTLEPSFVAFGTLTTNVGQTSYLLDNIAPNYGKARYLYTKNTTSSPSFNRQWVDFVEMDVLTSQYRGGDGSYGAIPYSNYPLISSAASVYYDVNRGNVLELAPIPQQSVVYDLCYEPATNRPQSKQGPGFTLEQFDSLVAAKLALKALIHCQWRGLSRKEAREQRREIREGLVYEIGSPESRSGLDYLFWQFSLTSKNTTSDTNAGFGQGAWW